MLFVGFIYNLAMTFLALTVFTLIAYAFPDSLPGQVLAIVK